MAALHAFGLQGGVHRHGDRFFVPAWNSLMSLCVLLLSCALFAPLQVYMFFFLLLVAGMLLRMTPGVRNALLNQEPFIMHIAPDANVFFLS